MAGVSGVEWDPNPMTREGFCSECGGAAQELWYRTDWWHRWPAECDGRETGKFLPEEE